MATSREVTEGQQDQGTDESIAYWFNSTPWGSTPTGVAVACYDITTGARTDVTGTNLTGTASVVGDKITLPALHSLTADHTYRVEAKFTVDGNVLETFVVVKAEY